MNQTCIPTRRAAAALKTVHHTPGFISMINGSDSIDLCKSIRTKWIRPVFTCRGLTVVHYADTTNSHHNKIRSAIKHDD